MPPPNHQMMLFNRWKFATSVLFQFRKHIKFQILRSENLLFHIMKLNTGPTMYVQESGSSISLAHLSHLHITSNSLSLYELINWLAKGGPPYKRRSRQESYEKRIVACDLFARGTTALCKTVNEGDRRVAKKIAACDIFAPGDPDAPVPYKRIERQESYKKSRRVRSICTWDNSSLWNRQR